MTQNFFDSASTIVSLILLVGGGFLITHGAYSRARLEALREDNNDLRSRIDDLEKREEIQAKDIQRLSSENVLLRNLVTSKAEVDGVLAAVNTHHTYAEAKWRDLLAAINEIKEGVSSND